MTSPAAVSVAVTPGSGLADGQFVAVHAAGLPGEHTIQVEQCAGSVSAPPPDNTACDALTLDTQTGSDAQGVYVNAPGDANGDTGFRVYTRPSRLLPSPTTITCDATHPCVLYVGVDQNDFSQPHAFADIRFAGGVTAPAESVPVPGVPVVGVPVAGVPVVGVPIAALTHVATTVTTTSTATATTTTATGGAATLAFTGPAPLGPALAGLGLAAVLLTSLARRRMLRGTRP